MNFCIKWEGFSTRFSKRLMDAWAEHKDFPEWFASAFCATVQAGKGNEAGGMIHGRDPRSNVTENHFSVRFSHDGTPENLIDLLFRFVLHTLRAVKREEGALPAARTSAGLSLSRKSA
jgi:hypothetical protein